MMVRWPREEPPKEGKSQGVKTQTISVPCEKKNIDERIVRSLGCPSSLRVNYEKGKNRKENAEKTTSLAKEKPGRYNEKDERYPLVDGFYRGEDGHKRGSKEKAEEKNKYKANIRRMECWTFL